MTEPNLGSFVTNRNNKFSWAAWLPKWRAWVQTLILLPFGLSVGNFLGRSWNFSANLITEEHQYLIGVLSMVFNLLLPSLFFAFLFNWCWISWRRGVVSWLPDAEGMLAGCYATLTVAVSFGMVQLFTQNVGVCGDSGWNDIGQNLLCNLDSYGFESKSLFGAWFIIAAYCYQAQSYVYSIFDRLLHRTSYSQSPTPIGFPASGDLAVSDSEQISEPIQPSQKY